MKKFSLLALTAVVMFGIAFTSCDSKKSSSVKLTSEIDSISYMIGKANAHGMQKNSQLTVDSWPMKGNNEAFLAGFLDGANNSNDTLYFGKDLMALSEYVNNFFQNVNMIVAEQVKIEGEKFLAENKSKEGVVTTESGLQYKVITQGKGAKPKADDVVMVTYSGSLIDGTEFDSSKGQPVQIPLFRVMQGWIEAFQLMPVGSKYMLWIPGDLAYGMNPPSQIIKPNSVLIFEVELFEIVKQ